MKNVLFVCLGNICRSPMGQFIFQKMVDSKGLSNKYYIRSAATSTWEIGNPVYPPAQSKLAEQGISCDGKRAVQMTKEDYNKYDIILGMEEQNIRDILRITGGDPEGKVKLLMSFTDTPKDIDDPWYTGDFDVTYNEIFEGCTCLLKYLEED